jgi:hypothetical protein
MVAAALPRCHMQKAGVLVKINEILSWSNYTPWVLSVIELIVLLILAIPHEIRIFALSSSQLGSARTAPSGKIIVGTVLYPLLTFITNSVASWSSSSLTRRYSILLASKNAFARLQSEQYSVVYITICDGLMV